MMVGIREIGSPGPLLGGWEGSIWEDRVVAVEPEETMLMYTDGVTDTRGEPTALEPAGSGACSKVTPERRPPELLGELEAALTEFQVEGHADDTGAVALRPRKS